MTRIRNEAPGDEAPIRALHEMAFRGDAEARLVDRLREPGLPRVSLVATDSGRIVGHILFTPVTVADAPALRAMGLAPMAVLPGQQRRGIGSALVRHGLDACREQGVDAVVVLGHPAYYPRFGFRPASRYALRCRWEAPDDAFLALELRDDSLRGVHGQLEFHPAFDDL